MNSNLLSVQSDCPHRERLPNGGDLVADSTAAMHMFDMSSFYKKTVRDWMDAQWDNGAYTTSVTFFHFVEFGLRRRRLLV